MNKEIQLGKDQYHHTGQTVNELESLVSDLLTHGYSRCDACCNLPCTCDEPFDEYLRRTR